MKKLLYLMVASSFLAAQVFTLNINIMQLSIYRATLFIISTYLLLEHLKNKKRINISFKSDQSIIIKFYFFWFMYSMFSLGWVKDYHSWLRAIFFIGSGFLCIWIMSSYVKSQKEFKLLFIIMLFMITFHNIIGWSELLTGVYKFIDISRIDLYNQFSYNPLVRVPVSMMGNPNDYATLMICGVFISYITFMNSKSKLVRLLSISSICSSIILIIKTTSRANILALIVGIIIFIYIRFFKKINIRTMLLIILLPTIILIYPLFLENIFQIISSKLQFSFDGGSDYIRLNLIKNGLNFLIATLGFGTGAGNIEYWMETKSLYYVGNIKNIHNWWMEILVGYGIFVFIGYISVYYKILKKIYKSYFYSSDKFIKNTSLALFCYMVSFIISSISSSSNIPKEWLWMFWGVVVAYVGYIERHCKIKIEKPTV